MNNLKSANVCLCCGQSVSFKTRNFSGISIKSNKRIFAGFVCRLCELNYNFPTEVADSDQNLLKRIFSYLVLSAITEAELSGRIDIKLYEKLIASPIYKIFESDIREVFDLIQPKEGCEKNLLEEAILSYIKLYAQSETVI